MGIYRHMCFIFLCVFFPTKVWGKYCDGGLLCTPPKECCSQGCCYVYPSPGHKSSTSPDPNAFLFFINEHWYFWGSALACLAVLGLCSLWNRRQVLCARFCLRNRVTGALSDRDSAGSCYLPPQYSRCSSFHHAPPPYTEVTSKPDMYPLVITYGDNVDKGGASYLMVHYFRNYIIRPSGSLSATSTADSLSSSFICNASNEANTIIPPPYSSTGNFDEWRHNSSAASSHRQAMLRSFSSLTCSHPTASSNSRTVRQSASAHFRAPAERSPDSNDRNSGCSIQTTAIRSPVRAPSEDEVFYADQPNFNVQSPRRAEGNMRSFQKRVTSTNNSYGDESLESDGSRSPGLRFIFNENTISNRTQAPPDSLIRDNQSYNSDARKYNVQSQFWINNLQRDLDRYKQNEIENFPNSSGNYSSHCYKMDKSMAQNIFSNDDNNTFRNKIFPNSSKSPFHRHYDLESPTSNEAVPANVEYNNYQSSIQSGIRISNNFSLQPNLEELRTSYISITGSEVSSIANISTPNSPPKASSPNSGRDENKTPNEHKSKIEPKTRCDFTSEASSSYAEPKTKRFFGKSRKSSLYMPLSLASNSKMFLPGKVSPTSNLASKCIAPRRGWLSRSAPTTPCGNGLMPTLMTVSQKKMSSSGSSKNNQEEDSPLLDEQEYTDGQQNVEF